MMKIVVLDETRDYDGRQLSTAFFDEHAPATEHSIVLFLGGADVPVEHMVDLEDAEAGDVIWSPAMAHALVEHRGMGLREAVLAQRLLVRLAAQWLVERAGRPLEVRGDDLYIGDGKLSVSVATTSPRGSLLHFAVNIRTEGTPVRTAGLADLRIPPREFLRAVGRLYSDEMASVAHAIDKVRSVP